MKIEDLGRNLPRRIAAAMQFRLPSTHWAAEKEMVRLKITATSDMVRIRLQPIRRGVSRHSRHGAPQAIGRIARVFNSEIQFNLRRILRAAFRDQP